MLACGWVTVACRQDCALRDDELAELGPPQRCGVPDCVHASGPCMLRAGAGFALCAEHLAEQCAGRVTWSADGHCITCWDVVAADDSWLLSSGYSTTLAGSAQRLSWVNFSVRKMTQPFAALDVRAFCSGRCASAWTAARAAQVARISS